MPAPVADASRFVVNPVPAPAPSMNGHGDHCDHPAPDAAPTAKRENVISIPDTRDLTIAVAGAAGLVTMAAFRVGRTMSGK